MCNVVKFFLTQDNSFYEKKYDICLNSQLTASTILNVHTTHLNATNWKGLKTQILNNNRSQPHTFTDIRCPAEHSCIIIQSALYHEQTAECLLGRHLCIQNRDIMTCAVQKSIKTSKDVIT